jgi:tetratricopeptide (TPR) repeat protein
METIGRELGVRYAVEGSVRAAGERLVVTSQLVDARTGVQVWGDRFETRLDDALAVQGQLAEPIVGALGAQIEEAELARLRHRPTEDFGAYELFVQARADFFSYTKQSHDRARERLDRALAIDPEYAHALVYRGGLETAAYALGWDPQPERLDRARGYIRRGIEIDPSSPFGHAAMSMVEMMEGRSEEGLEAARKAVSLGPNSDVCQGLEAVALAEVGRPLEALRALDRALRLNPRHPELYWLAAGFIQAQGGRTDLAVDLFERVRDANPEIVPPRLVLLVHHAENGEPARAQELAREIRGINPDLTAEQALRIYPFALRTPGLVETFRSAGLP